MEEEIIVKYSKASQYKRSRPQQLSAIFGISSVLVFKTFAQHDSHRHWTLGLIALLVGLILLGDYLKRRSGSKAPVQKIIVNANSIAHGYDGKPPTVIRWEDVKRIDFHESKRQGVKCVKVTGLKKSIKFTNFIGRYNDLRGAILSHVDESKVFWGRMNMTLVLGTFLIVNAVVLALLVYQDVHPPLLWYMIGIMDAIYCLTLLTLRFTMWKREP